MKTLEGLSVVITRPEAQGQRWQMQLQSLGAETFLLPVMQIAAVESTSQQQAIQNIATCLDQFQKIIFISQNAVTAARAVFPKLPSNGIVYAVGKATAAALRDWGASAVEGDETMNSESLLALSSLQSAQVEGEKILICRGVGGRTLLADTLRQRGAKIECCELYRRLAHPDGPKNLRQLLAKTSNQTALAPSASTPLVSAHSGESVELLAQLLEQGGESAQALKHWPLLLPGTRVAAIAQQLGFNQVICAVNASDEIMTECLQRWWAQRGES